MVKDKVNGNVVRADKYLVEWIETLLEDDKVLKSGGKLKDKKKAKVKPMTDEQVKDLQQVLMECETYVFELIHQL